MKTLSPQQAIQRLMERRWKPIHIAAELKVSKSTISRIQHGEVQPTFRVMKMLWDLVSSRRYGPTPKEKVSD
jgi:ribosome-binding protein aMBF1 (putative translation factor)